MKAPTALAFALALSATPLSAEPAPEEKCHVHSTAEIVDCHATQTTIWDRRLNTAYQDLMTSLRSRDPLRSAHGRGSNCATQTAPTSPRGRGASPEAGHKHAAPACRPGAGA